MRRFSRLRTLAKKVLRDFLDTEATMNTEFLSPAELAKRLNVSRRTVFRFVSAGKLPQPLRLSKRTVRWRWADVEAFLATHERPKRGGGRR